MDKLRILLIETSRLLRNGIISLLNEQVDITAVASTGTRSALEQAKAFSPQIVLIAPGTRTQKTQRMLVLLNKQLPQAKIVVIDFVLAREGAVVYEGAGIAGYLRRDASLEVFLHTIRSVANGAKLLPSSSQDSILKLIVEDAFREDRIQSIYKAIRLTNLEYQVAAILASGKSIQSAATLLHLTAPAIKAHLRNTIDKLTLYLQLESAFPTRRLKSPNEKMSQSKKAE